MNGLKIAYGNECSKWTIRNPLDIGMSQVEGQSRGEIIRKGDGSSSFGR